MPGKQMAIDADLNAALIDDKQARQRRKNLEDESGFFGAMDGASKFIRGDAIAGLLVVMINIIGGMIIGIVPEGLSFAEAGRTYTLLTVGDGLVTQIPALIVSTAAGLLVSKAGVSGAADKALFGQLSGYPKALGMSGGVMLVSPNRSSVRATTAALPCSRRISPNSSIWSGRNSNRRRAKARRRSWSPRPPFDPSCAASSSASAPRPRCWRSSRSARGRG
jgi:flagellar biosynthesis protein FlhA